VGTKRVGSYQDPAARAWEDEGTIAVCYITPKALFDEYAQDMRTRGEAPPLDLGDLRREMAKEPYWIAAPSKEPRVHRAQLNGSVQTCWVINLSRDKDGKYLFPFGEDLQQILEPNQKESVDAANAELARASNK
jgi:hypothetical protein